MADNEKYACGYKNSQTGEIVYYKDKDARSQLKEIKQNQIELIEDDTSMEGISDTTHSNLETVNKTIIGGINEINTQVKDIAISINNFPRLNVETNDYNRFVRAKENLAEGTTLFIPSNEYDFGGNSLTWDKNINIKGSVKPFYNIYNNTLSNGVILKNAKFVLKGNGYEIENIGLLSRTINNGFEANTGRCHNIKLKNCVSVAKSHCYLFESYEGLVNDIILENCESYEAIHGFISKADRVKFINCTSHGIQTYAFGAIADNIPLATKKGNGSNTEFINCKATESNFGYALYARDMFSSTNANKILLQNIKLINCDSNNCNRGIILGDREKPPTGVTYNTIYNILIDNFVEKQENPSSARGVELSRINGLKLNGYFDSEINKNGYEIINVDIDVINNKISNFITISDNKSIPTLSLSNMYENIVIINNTQDTVINGFLGGGFDTNKTILVKINEEFTTVTSGNNIELSQTIRGKGSYVYLKYNGSKFIELMSYSSRPHKEYKQINLVDRAKVNLTDGNLIEFVYNANTINKIELAKSYTTYDILIRPVTAGTLSFGGFNSDVIFKDIATSITFGKALCLKLQWINSLSKYIVVNSYLTNIS